jgi:hypothetical protein
LEPSQRGFQCATIKVPLDYAHPRDERIDLALIRHRAGDPDRRIGTVFYEPGGPGVPGTEFLPALAYKGFPPPSRPVSTSSAGTHGGVGESTAIKCFADQAAEDAPSPGR